MVINLKDNFDIENFVNNLTSHCNQVQEKTFQKGEVITNYIVNRKQICILKEGSADLIRYGVNGNKDIVERFNSKEIFGEIFYKINNNNDLFVLAKDKCVVLFFNYNIFAKKCTANCKFHDELVASLPNLILSKVSDLNSRIEFLSKRSIKDKLTCYFNILAEKNSSKTFLLPFSLTDLADYLSVDRSAMMRELSALKNNGVIKRTGKKITLL